MDGILIAADMELADIEPAGFDAEPSYIPDSGNLIA